MDFNQLTYFKTVAKYENITKAAKELHITQPNLSTSIAKLEDELGVRLFDRIKGRIILNVKGRRFLEYVERAFNELSNGVMVACEDESEPHAVVRVSSAVGRIMNDVAIECFQRWPKLKMSTLYEENNVCVQKLLSGETDIALLTISPEKMDRFEAINVLNEDINFLVMKEHPFAGRGTVSLAELAQVDLICDNTMFDNNLLYDLFRLNGYEPSICYLTNEHREILDVMKLTGGVSVCPDHIMPSGSRRELASDDNVSILKLAPQSLTRSIWLTRCRDRLLSYYSERVYECMIEFFASLREDIANYPLS